jgi:hypothetical protein
MLDQLMVLSMFIRWYQLTSLYRSSAMLKHIMYCVGRLSVSNIFIDCLASERGKRFINSIADGDFIHIQAVSPCYLDRKRLQASGHLLSMEASKWYSNRPQCCTGHSNIIHSLAVIR